MQLWDRGYLGVRRSRARLQEGRPEIRRCDGEKLQGGWVLVRMKRDRNGGKRTNWLLIKHRDEFASEGDGDDMLDEDRSVASGRDDGSRSPPARAGRQSRSCWRRTASGKADAVWHSNRGEAAEARAEAQGRRVSRASTGEAEEGLGDAGLRRAAALRVGRTPAGGDGWGHEIKFDGYRMQLRVEDGEPTLKTRKGLDWTEKFRGDREGGGALARCADRRRDRRARHNGAPDFSALQAALVRRQDRQPHLLRLRSAVRRRRAICARCRWSSARSG